MGDSRSQESSSQACVRFLGGELNRRASIRLRASLWWRGAAGVGVRRACVGKILIYSNLVVQMRGA